MAEEIYQVAKGSGVSNVVSEQSAKNFQEFIAKDVKKSTEMEAIVAAAVKVAEEKEAKRMADNYGYREVSPEEELESNPKEEKANKKPESFFGSVLESVLKVFTKDFWTSPEKTSEKNKATTFDGQYHGDWKKEENGYALVDTQPQMPNGVKNTGYGLVETKEEESVAMNNALKEAREGGVFKGSGVSVAVGGDPSSKAVNTAAINNNRGARGA